MARTTIAHGAFGVYGLCILENFGSEVLDKALSDVVALIGEGRSVLAVIGLKQDPNGE